MDQTVKLCNKLGKEANGYYAHRISAQINYLIQTFQAVDEAIPEDIGRVVGELHRRATEDGALTRQDVAAAETALAGYGPRAKQYHLACAAHAHIDMNWQWGTDETIGIVIDTFQTMLNLMREYPAYIFSQSQAATYEMIEKYCPVMLDEIKQRIREGRWEVTASSWVENDKNLSGTEAMVRHLLYTKQYLAKLLDLDPATLDLDFEPDTFGHTIHLPHILKAGGIKYYYHCRGSDIKRAYRWRAPSGSEVLATCEPGWYLGAIEYDMAKFVPRWCAANHTDTAMKVYGVGDHGGGPTRRDIERIQDMATWPLMPQIRFSTMRAFFRQLERNAAQLPVLEKENNFVFTGCYTSQARLKQANRHGEDHLCDSEALSAMAMLAGGTCANPKGFSEGWKRVLFNQFHDILPGSCVRETRECALGISREANGFAIGNANRAMWFLGSQVNTLVYGDCFDPESTAEGAGTGYNAAKASAQERAFAATTFGVSAASNGGGKLRAYTLFNSTQYPRREVVELTLWDWPLPLKDTTIRDGLGNEIAFEPVGPRQDYWRHEFDKIVFAAEVPAFGYTNYYVMEADLPGEENPAGEPRLIGYPDAGYTLESDWICAKFEPATMRMTSLVHKKSGKELLSAPAGFRLVQEMSNPMSAWRVGHYGHVEDLNVTQNITVTDVHLGGVLQWICYEMPFGRSKLKVRISLGRDDCVLRWSTEVDFQEVGGHENMLPQLQLCVPYAYQPQGIRYDVPGGILDRPELHHDVPSIRYAAPIPQSGCALVLTTDCKYGYRACDNRMILNLLRASLIPDRYPEQGVHQIEIGIGAADSADWSLLGKIGTLFAHPLYPYSNSLHEGTLGQTHSFLQVEGRVEVLSLKPAVDKGVVLRLANPDRENADAVIRAGDLQKAEAVDMYERAAVPLPTEGKAARLKVPHQAMGSLRLFT